MLTRCDCPNNDKIYKTLAQGVAYTKYEPRALSTIKPFNFTTINPKQKKMKYFTKVKTVPSLRRKTIFDFYRGDCKNERRFQ